MTSLCSFKTPREGDLGLARITNPAGVSISLLPTGCLFAIEHEGDRARTLVTQIQPSALEGGIGRLLLRAGEAVVELVGSGARGRFGAGADRFVWEERRRAPDTA